MTRALIALAAGTAEAARLAREVPRGLEFEDPRLRRAAADWATTLLEQETPVACVTAEMLVYDDAGALVEIGRHLYRADRYTVETSVVV